MKVALCLFGQPRHIDIGYHSIKEKILDVYHPDVFYHVWSQPLQGYEVGVWREQSTSIFSDVEYVRQLYQPKQYIAEEGRKFYPFPESNGYKLWWGKNNTSNCLSQLYSRRRSRDMLLSYSQMQNKTYDIVIMCRFDLLINDLPVISLPLNNLFFTADHQDRIIFGDIIIISPFNDFITLFGTDFERYLFDSPIKGSTDIDLDMQGSVVPSPECLIAAAINEHKLNGVKTFQLSASYLNKDGTRMIRVLSGGFKVAIVCDTYLEDEDKNYSMIITPYEKVAEDNPRLNIVVDTSSLNTLRNKYGHPEMIRINENCLSHRFIDYDITTVKNVKIFKRQETE
jgi:hypothetical protein